MLAYLVDYMGERLVFVTLFVFFFWRFLALAQSLRKLSSKLFKVFLRIELLCQLVVHSYTMNSFTSLERNEKTSDL